MGKKVLQHKNLEKPSVLERFSMAAIQASGRSSAFIVAFTIIIIWILSGPLFGFSDTWQLVINTGTSIITFLMVFLIQRAQNKDSIALHLKLNELIVAQKLANNRLVAVEEISEHDLKVLRKFYERLAELAQKEKPIEETHSIDQAMLYHQNKSTKHK